MADDVCRDLWRTAAAMLRLSVWQHDLVADVGVWSEEARELYGIGDEPVARDSFLLAVHPDDRDEIAGLVRALLEGDGDRTERCHHRIVCSGGQVRWLETSLRVERDRDRRPICIIGASLDRTESEHSQKLRPVEVHARVPLGEQTGDPVFIADARGRFVEVNDHACELLGYTRAELLSKTVSDLLAPDDAQTDPPTFESLVVGHPVRRDRRLRHKNGGGVYVELSLRRLPDGRVHALARDITRRVAAERALSESERVLQEWGANLPALLWVREVESERLLYANDAWEAVLGKRPVIGEKYWQLVEPVHPEDLPRLVVAPLRGPDQDRDEEVRFVLPSGAIRWYRVCKFGIRDDGGEPDRVAGFCIEVTEQRTYEETIRTSLREKEVLLREVHHRVKNNLQIVSSLLRLQATSVRNPALSTLLRESQSRVTAMALVHDLLHKGSDFSRITFTRYAQALAAAISSTYGSTSESIRCVVEAHDHTLTIDQAVPCGIILNEIVSNSFKHAYPQGGPGTIRVVLERDPAGRYRLSVSDDGRGLPADLDERKRASIGIQLIENLVGQLEGELSWTSGPSGTTYDIVFRADDGAAPP